MFTIEELTNLSQSDDMLKVTVKCNQYLLEDRLKVKHESDFTNKELRILNYFPTLVMGGVAQAENSSLSQWGSLSGIAADFEYTLYLLGYKSNENDNKFRHIRRACILYEIAQIPGVSATLANIANFPEEIRHFFSREGNSNFGKLSPIDKNIVLNKNDEYDPSTRALNGILHLLGSTLQNSNKENLNNIELMNNLFFEASMNYELELSADEQKVFSKAMYIRNQSSISNYVDPSIIKSVKVAGLPAELWPMQQSALKNGVLDFSLQSWGLAAPTGTGKTSIAQLILINFFEKHPNKKAFYIVPSRALASQVALDLLQVLAPLGKKVGALGSHLTYNELVLGNPEEMDLLIFTPEKADLLLRIEPDLLKQTKLVIVDEAHHIEAGTRGILLEFYLWRLRTLIQKECEIIQLSAVAPNIQEMVEWLGEKDKTSFVKNDWRTGKFRIGLYEREDDASGVISFSEREPIKIHNKGTVESNPNNSLAQLALSLSDSGIVLVLVSSKAQAETLAKIVTDMRKEKGYKETPPTSEYLLDSLDARLERELYVDVPLRENIRYGVTYHHGGLPSRVRSSIENAIKEKKVNIVFATTTLAEGVNFPFSTVIVQSLIVGTDTTLSPRGLWNIAGRAGRFGVDLEGHCILFRPSLWKDKLKGYELKDYFNNSLDGIPSVKSAYAEAIEYVNRLIQSEQIKLKDLEGLFLQDVLTKLPNKDKKVVSGLINTVRVGLTHAHANGLIDVRNLDTVTFAENLFATTKMTQSLKRVAAKIEKGQRKVIRDSIISDDRLLAIAARIGWTIETQSLLVEWIKGLKDWEIERYGKLVNGGEVNSRYKLNSLLYPIAERMTEFEGTKLGGFTTYISSHWIQGNPLSTIREETAYKGKKRDFSSLIDMIYTRIQYLLPWALFGVDELLRYEAKKRKIFFGSGVKDLSILASEGVPSFDALTLVLKLNIERVDATRLANFYNKGRHDTDIIGWFKAQSWAKIIRIVSGSDRRRIDPELRIIHESLVSSDFSSLT